MTRPLLPDELRKLIRRHLPEHNPRFWGGRPPIDDRTALAGIILVLRSGIPWEELPQETGCGFGMTCWQRLRDWRKAGVWGTVRQLLLNHLREADKLDFSRAGLDSTSVRAFGRGENTGPNPTDRCKPGSRHHVVTDAHGIPWKTKTTAASRHDSTQLIGLIDEIPAVAGKPGRPRWRPDEVYADCAYNSDPHRRELSKRHIEPHLARRNEEHGSGLGVFRWVSERALAWVHGFRRLRTRYDRRADTHESFVTLAECLIYHRTLATGDA